MADKDVSPLPPPTLDDLAVAAKHFEYANRATVAGNHDIAIQMLRTCCDRVPGQLSYRQALRKAQKAKYRDNKQGASLSSLSNAIPLMSLRRAVKSGQYKRALVVAEAILSRNPWDRTAILLLSEAAAKADLPVVAVWNLQDARESCPKEVEFTRALARLLEAQKHFTQAMTLWEIIRKTCPTDTEAQGKIRQMAVNDTMSRANFGGSSTELAALSLRDASATPPPPSKMTPVQRRPADEAEGLRSRIQKDPARPELYLQLASVYRKLGNLVEAHNVLRKGLEATNQAPELAFALADLEVEPYRRKLAETEEKLKSAPSDDSLLKTREKLQKKINKLELASCEKKALSDPGDRAARFDLGVRRFRAGLVQEAIPELQAARSDAKLQWEALLYLGRCFKALGNWPLAQRNFDEALRHVPRSESAQVKDLTFELASGHAAAGEFERAVELGLDLADMDYAYRDIGRLLGQWQERLGQNGSRKVKQV